MDVLHACCAGLDVHKRTVVACVRRVDPAGKVSKGKSGVNSYFLRQIREANPVSIHVQIRCQFM